MRPSRLLLIMIALAAWPAAARAEPAIPGFWDAKERLVKPDLASYQRIRFLTTIDFPPFNFLDGAGRLTGFHVDLARAICTELDVLERCEIQALPWDELEAAMRDKDGEAIIAGISVTEAARESLDFSRPYLRFPARFVTPKSASLAEPVGPKLAGKRVGVMAGSTHERILRDYFPDVRVVTYTRQEWIFGDLKASKLDAAFGDGMRLGFWLAGADSAGCCRYSGGPYLAPEYLGSGLAIAVEKENGPLAVAFDYALQQIAAKGVFAELYLRYFPVGFF
ncbi:MAG: transporter substrate-binding domain-containing protein [Rhizobiaceae bacterium]